MLCCSVKAQGLHLYIYNLHKIHSNRISKHLTNILLIVHKYFTLQKPPTFILLSIIGMYRDQHRNEYHGKVFWRADGTVIFHLDESPITRDFIHYFKRQTWTSLLLLPNAKCKESASGPNRWAHIVAMGTVPRESGPLCTAGGTDMQDGILVWSTWNTGI